GCLADAERAFRGFRPQGRRRATGTSASRRSGRPSRQGAIALSVIEPRVLLHSPAPLVVRRKTRRALRIRSKIHVARHGPNSSTIACTGGSTYRPTTSHCPGTNSGHVNR